MKLKILTLLFNLKNHESELELQNDVEKRLKDLDYIREYRFDEKNIIDFYLKNEKVGIECKFRSQNKVRIFKQIERYLQFDIKGLILITYTPIRIPKMKKPVFVVNCFKNI